MECRFDIIQPGAKWILVVEDGSTCAICSCALLLNGCQVQKAGDGLATVRLIDSNPPDVIGLDLGQPVVSGEAARLKSDAGEVL